MGGNKTLALVSAGLFTGCSILVILLRRYCDDPGNNREREEEPRRYQLNSGQRIIEVSLADVESAMAAWEGGATSIELCADREQGGVTPSIGLVKECTRRLGSLLQVHVLIRPRGGDFVYSHEEFDVMLQDVLECKKCGAAGVVVGVLTHDGRIDVPRMKVLREVSAPMMLTFHRAYDICTETSEEALRLLAELKCDRLLTSGRAESAVMGEPHLQRLATNKHRGSIAVIAAAGVTSKNAKSILINTSVQGVHASSALHTTRAAKEENKYPEFSSWKVVSSDAVSELVAAVHRVGQKH